MSNLQRDLGFLLGFSQAPNYVQQLRTRLEAFKTEGNKAEQNKEYTKALQMYDDALVIAQQSPELYKEAAILYSNKSNVLYQLNDFKTALTNAIAATNSDPEYSKGYYWSGKALLNLESAVDAFLTFIGGCSKSKNDGDKVLLLTEAAMILNSLSDVDLQSCYEKLHQFNTSVWPDVLTRLSQRAEWKSIAYLILGSNLDVLRSGEINTTESIDQFCTGVAGKSSTAAVETRTVFTYLEQHDGKDIAHWLDAVLFAVYSHGGEQTLTNLVVDDRDCPLHAVTRFVLQTERTSLLEVFPHQGPSWCDVSSGGESVFHLLAKHSPPVPADFLVKVTKSILEKGFRSIMMKDVNGELPFNLLDITYPMSVFDVFLPDDTREMKMDKLNNKGVSKSEHGDYCGAILLFSKVIDFHRQEAESNSYLYRVILQNRAKSYLQQNEYQKALNDAKESMNVFIENQEPHWIAGMALIGLEKYGQACTELLFAYDCVTTSGQSKTADILFYLSTLFSLPVRLHYYGMMGNGRHGHVWAQVCYLLVQNNDWKSASEAYYLFKSSVKPIIPLKLDLKPFCSIKDIRSNPWVADIMLYLSHCGSDKRTISLEEGDTYLHAAVKISLVAKRPALISYLVKRKMGDSDQHKLDSHGNTLLHMATKERKVDTDIRFNVIEIIQGCNVDPHVQDCKRKLAISYLSGEKKNRNLILGFMQTKEKQKTPTNQTQNRSVLNKAKTISQNKKAKRNQGRAHTCEKCERIYSNAVEKLTVNIIDGLKLLVEVLNTDHNNQQHTIIEKKALGDFSKHIGELSMEDASICLDSLRKEKYFTIIDVLICDKRWLLLELTIQKSKKLFAEGELKEFASKFTVELLVRDTPLDSEEEKHRVVLNLLENGWRIADDNGKMVVKNAVELKEFKVAIELINRGADSSMISVYSGDTPIHAAILIALQEKQVTFIQALLDKQVGDKDKYTYLDPEQVDTKGDSIYHLLAKADFNDFVLRLTQMLCNRMVSAKYYNKELKYPNDYVKERDSSLLKLLEEASRIKPSHEKVADKKLKKDEKSVSPKEIEVSLESKSKHPPKMLTEQIEETKKRIETLIIALPKSIKATYVERQNLEIAERDKHINNENSSFSEIPAVLSMVDITESKANTDHESKGDIENKRTKLQKERIFQKEIEQNISEHEIILTENDTFSHTETQKRREGARSKTLEDIAESVSFAPKDVEEYDHVSESELALLEDNDISEPPPLESDEGIVDRTPQNMEPNVSRRQVNIDENDHDSIDITDEDDDLELENMFESLTWEVEYTDKVRKTLENKHVLPALRRKIIQIIRRLANGDWQNNYCRELTNVPKSLKLFEANLSKGRRIIWERAISFSSRCSDIADQRLNLSTDDSLPQVNGGKIYTEVIRIWDIVMDHNKINRLLYI